MQILHAIVSETQENEAGKEEKSKKVTVPKPFNITQQKPKKVKEEEAPIEPFHPKPVPEKIYTTNLETIKSEKAAKKEEVRKQTMEKYSKGAKPFKFKTDERPMYKDELIKEAKEEEKKLLQFNKKYHEPPLNFKEIEAEVRLNAAAIMREEYLIQKKAVEEEKKLKSYEVDLHNSGEFDRWQKEMKEKEATETLYKILPFMNYCPLVLISAKTGYNIRKSIEVIDAVAAQTQIKLPTGMLNRTLVEATHRVVAPAKAGKRLRVYYAVQVGTSPILIRMFVNDPKLATKQYTDFMTRTLRERFGLEGAPVVILYRARSRPEDDEKKGYFTTTHETVYKQEEETAVPKTRKPAPKRSSKGRITLHPKKRR
jgi:hypothetical protein